MRLRAVVLLALVSTACGSSSTSPSSVITSLSISGAATLAAIGQTTQLSATVTFSGGKAQDVTGSVAWASSNTAVATVSSAGLVTALAFGTATISATYQGRQASQPLILSPSARQISACGAFSGPGPFSVTADVGGAVNGCLTFTNSVSGQLLCQGHDVSSVMVSNAQGFLIQNCAMHAGATGTLNILGSNNVTVDSIDVLGTVRVSASLNTVIMHSTIRYPLLPAGGGSFPAAALDLQAGQGSRITQNTIDGGWDGNLATYERQGCDDGILMFDETNPLVTGNTIQNVFDAGIEASGPNVVTAVVQNNSISHAGTTGIGGYYVSGWQNSVFDGNTVTNTPNLITFNASGARQGGVVALTFVNNRITNNTFSGPVPLAAIYGGSIPPAMIVDYVTGGLPYGVSGNTVQTNRFDVGSAPPLLLPQSGFIDGGGNVCQPGGFLLCR